MGVFLDAVLDQTGDHVDLRVQSVQFLLQAIGGQMGLQYFVVDGDDTLYGIPLDARDPDMSSAVMEAMAYEGWKTVTPAVFETAMKLKYTHDEDSIRMLDIIRDSISFDFGRVFNSMLNSVTYTMFRGVVNGTGNWSSTLASNLKVMDKQLSKLLEKFE